MKSNARHKAKLAVGFTLLSVILTGVTPPTADSAEQVAATFRSHSQSAQTTKESKDFNVCDLTDPASLAGQIVAVSGKMYFDRHGGYFLTGSSCPRPESAVVLLFPHSADAPHVSFDLEPGTDLRFAPFVHINGGSSFACGTVVGQLFYKPHFHLRGRGGGPIGNGFGPRGTFRVALVVKAVPDISACQ